MAAELGWDEPRTHKGLEEVQALYPAWVRPDRAEVQI